VTVVEMTPGLLPGADRDLVQVLEKRLQGLFATIMLETKVVKVAEEKNGIRVTFEGKEARRAGPPGPADGANEQVFDRVLVAIGRRPNGKVPGLETTKVKVDAKGFIEDRRAAAHGGAEHLRDRRRGREPMLAHKGVARSARGGRGDRRHKAIFEPAAIPAVVFTDPSSRGPA
jgi:dihydrolipoamide dehydrogenase